MTEERFIKLVLSQMPRATEREGRDISRELAAHMEDARAAYAAAGFDAEEAQRRVVEAMGDPKELGRALNAQLSPFWLWLSRIARAVCAVAAVGLTYSLLCRFCPGFEQWANNFLWAGR